jgi:hypothetical protein
MNYDKFVLDDGRITGYVNNGRLTHCEYGEDGINQLNTNTMNENNNVSQDNYARSVGGPMPGMGQPSGRPSYPGDYPRASDMIIPTVRQNKAREIHINQQDHGYIVIVGCQTLVFENMNTLIEKLTAYLKDPNAVEKKWMTEGIL